ncbi:MAG TPA: hypothetical protein VK524_14280, partial [Polyangiaceae bacterium]|nr:hypothetical protein [Polyangiaceae bacterium]
MALLIVSSCERTLVLRIDTAETADGDASGGLGGNDAAEAGEQSEASDARDARPDVSQEAGDADAGDARADSSVDAPDGDAPTSCKPAQASCYVSGPNGPGNECFAKRDNEAGSRVQLRQTWGLQYKPIALADERSVLRYAFLTDEDDVQDACNSVQAITSYPQIVLDWDRSNADIAQQTLRLSYSTRATSATPARDGLCMRALDYVAGGPPGSPLAANPETWRIAPSLMRRVADPLT